MFVGNGNSSSMNPLECGLSQIGMRVNWEWLQAVSTIGFGLVLWGCPSLVYVPMYRLNKNEMIGFNVYDNMVSTS